MSHAWEPGMTRYLPTDREYPCLTCGQPSDPEALDRHSSEALEHGDVHCSDCSECVCCGRWVENGLERRTHPLCERCMEEPEP